MIEIERPKNSTPAGLAKDGARELRKNRAALKRGLKEDEKLKFKAYSKEAVKQALADIFGRKCAFCESILLGTQAGDIEHYRPKGEVHALDSVTGKNAPLPGYYWLAAKWSNLLIACADCNRPRTQLDFDNTNRVIGKSTHFPLANLAGRAKGPVGLNLEQPLLLNPCADNPSDHLVFLDDGRVEAISIGGAPSQRGVATIHCCGLARSELLQMRARHRKIVMAAIRHTVSALEAGIDPGADLDDLITMLHPKEAYVAFTRMLVRKYMAPYLVSLDLDALL
ncbi:hypothetical protein ALQ32_01383 [Pseudomonas syringae pv. tagetis]|uniref:TIGR02646 family protein n=1 Tax=Pseudomonas syringae pv. tagetis TaxID=129140 RepID=A0A3M3Z5M1_9PSED|nr:hypothetical protein [Pseudomonas syringae group genomosp. 7]RMO89916.1 hypothetical protein ALQ32_01383 [Pseudomonas syringae pv. tagetis]